MNTSSAQWAYLQLIKWVMYGTNMLDLSSENCDPNLYQKMLMEQADVHMKNNEE